MFFFTRRSLIHASDNVATRTLENGVNVNGGVTIESCTAACLSAGYTLAGAEYSVQVQPFPVFVPHHFVILTK